MVKNLPTQEMQDLGEATRTIRPAREVGGSGVATLVPNEDASHLEAMEEIRAIIDEYYGESIDRVVDNDGDRVVVERLVVNSDDLPHMEYSIVSEIE